MVTGDGTRNAAHGLAISIIGSFSRRSWVGLKWALPGVVIGVVVPFSVSVGDAFQFLVSNIVVGVGVGSGSVDSFLSGDQGAWLVDRDGASLGSEESKHGGEIEFHFIRLSNIIYQK